MYQVVPNHHLGPAVVSNDGCLVDHGPLESIERICAALNAAQTADLHWAVPEFFALNRKECDRVIRALAKQVRRS